MDWEWTKHSVPACCTIYEKGFLNVTIQVNLLLVLVSAPSLSAQALKGINTVAYLIPNFT